MNVPEEGEIKPDRTAPKQSYPGSLAHTALCHLTVALSSPILLGLGTLAVLLRPVLGMELQEKVSLGLIKAWMRLVLSSAGVGFSLSGLDKLDRGKRYTFVCNHQSHLDSCVVCASLTHRYHIVGLAERALLYVPLLGTAMWAEGSRFIDRHDHSKAVVGCKKLAEEVSSSPYKSLFVCPEGTRSRDGTLGTFHKGAVVLAIDTGLPVVPMAVIGTYDVLPIGSMIVHPRPIKVVCGDPIDIEGFDYGDRDRLGFLLQRRIQALLRQHDTPPPLQDTPKVESFLSILSSPRLTPLVGARSNPPRRTRSE